METKEAIEIIHAGIAWANWTEEQQAAMREALKCMYKLEEIRKESNDVYDENIDLSDFGERVLNLI